MVRVTLMSIPSTIAHRRIRLAWNPLYNLNVAGVRPLEEKI